MSEGRQSIRTAQTKILIYHLRRRNIMKKTYKIDVDCANCANKMEEATKKTPGVKDAILKAYR